MRRIYNAFSIFLQLSPFTYPQMLYICEHRENLLVLLLSK